MKWIKIGAIGTVVLLICIVIGLVIKVKRLRQDYSISMENNKAYQMELQDSQDQARMYKLTIEQLEYMNDSISIKLNSVVEELNIKKKQLQSLSYIQSEATKTDTIVYQDTIFQPFVDIDTIIGDTWYNTYLLLQYPNTIVVSPTFISEKYIITNYKKETINPPKKFFLFRWFQKKHKVVEVNVIEENPYIENKQSRFIEIVE